MMFKPHASLVKAAVACALGAMAGTAFAGLNAVNIWKGNVGLSVDGVGSNFAAVGNVQAQIPVGATILQAYLYSAGTPFPFYPDSPNTLAAYNGSGISLAGNAIRNFDTLVGAISTPRPDIGRWFTARADVTNLVRSLTAGAAVSNFSWAVTEGALNTRIDGEVLAIVYSLPTLVKGSVVLLDGGQDTGGETTNVSFGAPIGDPNAAGFVTQLGLGISFSCCNQESTVKINGATLTTHAGNNDDGDSGAGTDGSLITVGGLGDTPVNNPASYADDHELYNLAPLLKKGDTGFTIFTQNATSDDNIFFASLYSTEDLAVIPGVPEPTTYALMLAGLGVIGFTARRRSRR